MRYLKYAWAAASGGLTAVYHIADLDGDYNRALVAMLGAIGFAIAVGLVTIAEAIVAKSK